MVVDKHRHLPWACTYDDTLAPQQPAYLSAYDLGTGALTASYVMPGESGFCNDVTLDDEGNVYATDSFANTIVRLPDGGDALENWATSDAFADEPWAITLNGIEFDGHDRLYVVKSSTGELFSVRIKADGSAGAPRAITVNPPLEMPDGLEIAGDGTLVIVENTGSVASVDLCGSSGQKSVLAGGLLEPTTAAIHRGSAWVVEGQLSLLFSGGDPSLPFRVKRVALDE